MEMARPLQCCQPHTGLLCPVLKNNIPNVNCCEN